MVLGIRGGKGVTRKSLGAKESDGRFGMGRPSGGH